MYNPPFKNVLDKAPDEPLESICPLPTVVLIILRPPAALVSAVLLSNKNHSERHIPKRCTLV